MDTLVFLEVRRFCFSKDTVKGMKSQATDWKQIFAEYLSDKKTSAQDTKKKMCKAQRRTTI